MIDYISPTQIGTVARCKRLYWRLYPNGEKQPQTAAQALGSAIHDELEAYYADGTEPKYDKLVRAFELGLLPERSEYIQSESEVWYIADDLPLPLKGRADVWYWTGPPHDPILVVCDLKTSSNVRRYGLTQDQLPHDMQLCIYAAAVAQAAGVDDNESLQVELVHVQLDTKHGIDPVRVSARLLLGDVFDTIRPYRRKAVPEIVDLWSEAYQAPEDVPAPPGAPHHSACGEYAGCPFISDCALIAAGGSIFHQVGDNPNEVTQVSELQRLFDKMGEDDQRWMLAKAGVESVDGMEPYADEAIEAIKELIGAPSHSDLKAWQALASYHDVPLAEIDFEYEHPLDRADLVKSVKEAIAVQYPGAARALTTVTKAKAYFANLEAEAEDERDAGGGMFGRKAERNKSGAFARKPEANPVQPDDAAPDGPPPKKDPALAPLTDIHGIGKTVAGRFANALGTTHKDLTIRQAAEALISGEIAIEDVTGLSEDKAQAILDRCDVKPDASPTFGKRSEKTPAEPVAPETTTIVNVRSGAPSSKGQPIDLFVVGGTYVQRRGDLRVVRLDDLVAEVGAQVAEAEDVPHYKAVEYGKGPGLVAQRLRATVKKWSAPVVYCSSDLPQEIKVEIAAISAAVVYC